MKRYFAFILTSALALAACDGQPKPAAGTAPASAPVTASTPTTTTASEAVPTPNANATTINSQDGAFQFTPDVAFSDKLNDGSLRPEGMEAEQITLLQYDANRNLTITAVKNGAAKGDSNSLFVNLKTQLQAEKSLSNVLVGEANGDQLSYQFERQDGNNTIAESCITRVSANKEISTLCASSTELSTNELTQFLNSTVKAGA